MSVSLYEVKIRNRVVKGSSVFQAPSGLELQAKGGSKIRRIKGTQGGWYEETLLYLAENESEAHQMAITEVRNRPILGIPRNTKRKLWRQVEILDSRRLA